MGGPSDSSLRQQQQITNEQLQISEEEFRASQADQARRNALMQPAIDFNKALTSGDRTQAFSAMAPVISNISEATTNATGAIREELPPGAAREALIADTERGGKSAVASALSNAYTGAFDKLANIGAGLGSFSLQEVGAAISGGNAASNANQVRIQAGEQEKASTMGFLGELAGAGGAIASAGMTRSDRRYKSNIRRTSRGLDDIERMEVVDYLWMGNRHEETGLIAQDLYEILPEAVIRGNDEKPWMIDYSRIVPVLIQAIKELKSEVTALKREQLTRVG